MHQSHSYLQAKLFITLSFIPLGEVGWVNLALCASSCSSLSCVILFATPWTVAHQASRSFSVSWSLLRFICIESVMPSSHPILCHPLLLLPSVFSSIRVFSNESAICIKWPKYWSFSFSISPSQWVFRIDFLSDWLVGSPCSVFHKELHTALWWPFEK